MSLKAKKIQTMEDAKAYVEGCLNDFEAGVSTKCETMDNFLDYTLRIIKLAGYKAECTCDNGCDFHIKVREGPKIITAREIIEIVCQYFSLTPFDLIQKTRVEAIRVPRHIAAYYIRRYTKHNLATIGLNIGLSHSAIINSCRYVQNLIDTSDPQYKDSIENINRKINSN